MSNDNRELDGKEICNEKRELTQEELEQVSGGNDGLPTSPLKADKEADLYFGSGAEVIVL